MAVENGFKESTVTTTYHTVNYDLPLWAGDDATSWLTQVNDAMNKIDSGIYEAKQSSHEVVTIAENAQKLAEETKAESDASAKIVEGYESRLNTVEDTTAEHTTDLTNLSRRVDTQDTEIHSIKEVERTILTDIGTLKTDVANTKKLAQDAMEEVSTTVPKVEAAVLTANAASAKAELYGSRITTLETLLSTNGEYGTTKNFNDTGYSDITTKEKIGAITSYYVGYRHGNNVSVYVNITGITSAQQAVSHLYVECETLLDDVANTFRIERSKLHYLSCATTGVFAKDPNDNNDVLIFDVNLGSINGVNVFDFKIKGTLGLTNPAFTWENIKPHVHFVCDAPLCILMEVEA